MDEKGIVTLTEVVERTKNNTSSINELREDTKEKFNKVDDEISQMKTRQEAIFELTSSVKLIAQDLGNIKESIGDIKKGQADLSVKVDTQIKEMDLKIKDVDNKSKIDMLVLLKNNWYKLMLGAGGISAIVYFIQRILN